MFFAYVLLCAYLLVGLICAAGYTAGEWSRYWDPDALFEASIEHDCSMSTVYAVQWLLIPTLFLYVWVAWLPLVWPALRGEGREKEPSDEVGP